MQKCFPIVKGNKGYLIFYQFLKPEVYLPQRYTDGSYCKKSPLYGNMYENYEIAFDWNLCE